MANSMLIVSKQSGGGVKAANDSSVSNRDQDSKTEVLLGMYVCEREIDIQGDCLFIQKKMVNS